MTTEIYDITDFPDPIPRASYFRVYECPACPYAHIVLFDDNDNPFAQFVVSQINVQRIVDDCSRVNQNLN